jgi:hypothetical protein
MEELRDLLDKLIYLDPDFVSLMYEEIRDVSPKTQFTKVEGLNAEGGIPLFKAGVHSQETKTFSLSSVQMLKDIYEALDDYPNFEPENFKNSQGAETVWIEGKLTMAEYKNPKKAESFIVFELYPEKVYPKGKSHSLIVQPENFSSGIGALLTIDGVLRGNIDIPVKCLGRVLYLNERITSFVTYPYLILEA